MPTTWSALSATNWLVPNAVICADVIDCNCAVLNDTTSVVYKAANCAVPSELTLYVLKEANWPVPMASI